MYTVTYTNTDGNQMRLLLTDAEFESAPDPPNKDISTGISLIFTLFRYKLNNIWVRYIDYVV